MISRERVQVNKLVFDWNNADLPESKDINHDPSLVEIQDETGRDGEQATYVIGPSVSEKKLLLQIDATLGVNSANIGFPGSSNKQYKGVIDLGKFVVEEGLNLGLTCAARTHQTDLEAIVNASGEIGIPIEAGMFIRSSQLGVLVEEWTLDDILRMVDTSVRFAVHHQIPVMCVAEDSTRAHPDVLKALYTAAIDAGASRLCIADTVGIIEDDGLSKLTHFVIEEIIRGRKILLDFHGHNDSGFAISNARLACKLGFDRFHATWLGVGERAGNTSLDQSLVNFRLKPDLKKAEFDPAIRAKYVRLERHVAHIAKVLGYEIPPNYPFFGSAVFMTNTGTHTAAIEKAEGLGLNGLARLVFSPIDPHDIGAEYGIGVGPISGVSNVRMCFKRLGINPTEENICAVLEYAKESNNKLSDEEIRMCVGNI